MKFPEIEEFPYHGTITRVIAGKGREADTELLLYDGIMDEHQRTVEEGTVMQTADYIISIPLVKDESEQWIVPKKGDKITLERYGETILFEVQNAEPSQIAGVSIYAARKTW